MAVLFFGYVKTFYQLINLFTAEKNIMVGSWTVREARPVYIKRDVLPLVGIALGSFGCIWHVIYCRLADGKATDDDDNSKYLKKSSNHNKLTFMNMVNKRSFNSHTHKSMLVVNGGFF